MHHFEKMLSAYGGFATDLPRSCPRPCCIRPIMSVKSCLPVPNYSKLSKALA